MYVHFGHDLIIVYRTLESGDRHLTVLVRGNMSYVPTPSRPTASQPPSQTGRASIQGETASANNYSSFGPTYETVDSGSPRQPERGSSHVSVRERYEFAEIHAETDSDVPDAVGASYEVPVNLGQSAVHEEYSHLQH